MSTVSWLAGQGLPASRTQLVLRAPQLAVWVLAVALGVQAAVIVTQLAGSGATHLPPDRAATGNSARPPLNLAALGNGHLFGQPPAPPPVDDANAPATNMALVLVGTIAGADPKNGLAIIGTAPQHRQGLSRWRSGAGERPAPCRVLGPGPAGSQRHD